MNNKSLYNNSFKESDASVCCFVFFFVWYLWQSKFHFPFFNDQVQKLKPIFRTIIFHEYIQLMNQPIFQNNKQETGEL